MVLQVVFLICAAISAACIVLAIKEKRRNLGYIAMTALVVACDIICFRLLGCKNVNDARNILTEYYICHALCYIGVIWMIMAIGRRKRYMLFCVPTAVVSVCQVVIMSGNYSRNRIMSFSRHLLFGGAWWVAEDGKNKGNINAFMSFHTYRTLILVNLALILVALIFCCVHSAKIFRTRFYALIIIHILFAVFEGVASVRSMPVWIICFAMNIICIIFLYLTAYYSNKTLRDWSLVRFANDMSDGFLLYNQHGDLIHVNDIIKFAFPPGLIKTFESKSNLDEWVSDTINVENMDVLKYELEGKDTYYKTKTIELKDYDSNLGTIYILHDTTESILKMRAMKEANVELERAAKMKSDFLANMSHEIRTPMNAVIGMAEIALREELPPHVEDYIKQIQNSGRNLLNIINDILDFSKIESGKMEIIPEKYEPLSEINDIANILATRIGDKPLELFVICDNNMPHALEGDVMRIRQVLINLANNAIKFTQQGIVLIKISVEETGFKRINLNFNVIDTGQGIKNEDLTKLFVSFQQVDSKRNRSVEGTGLGLAISQKLCEAMGGTIGVTSEYGKGSDFHFSIPQKVVDDSHDLVVEDAEKKHAYVINDNPKMLEMFIEEMGKLGVDGHVIPSLSEFKPSGEIDLLFFEEDDYTDEIKSYLEEHTDVIGVILVDFDSTFEEGRPNLRIMRRPETTLSMVMTLNGREFTHGSSESNEAFKIDFIAPDAKILIVDDNAINITIAQGLMKPIRAKCIGAGSGKEAIEKIQKEDFDIILMDHMMPEMDGVETTKVIRSTIHKADDTPIIALTANAMEGVKEMFLSEGMNDFVAKPIEIRNLVSKLKQWLPKEKILTREKMRDVLEAEAAAKAMRSAAAGAGGNGAGATGSGAVGGAAGTSGEEMSGASSDGGTASGIGTFGLDAFGEALDGGETLFVEYEGLDHKKAIEALGSPELYQTIVKEYYRSGYDKYNEIQNAYDSEDWPDYTIKVHALKSSSRQIGALELGDMAEELEKAGKALDMDTINGNTEGTLAAFKQLLDNLSKYFAEEESNEEELAEITEEDFNRILDELLAACDDLDMDKMEESKAELKKYSHSDEVKEILDQVYDAIDDIDVDTCVELIGELKKNE